jgi:two-component system chemotaxis response regulator CheY
MNLTKARILIVDDDRLMRSLIVNGLRQLGVQDVHESEDGSSGLLSASKLQPDLILTDIHMTPMNGLDFVKQLRALPNVAISATKVIFMSADASKETLSAALPLGILGYIVKPPKLEALHAKIEAALR